MNPKTINYPQSQLACLITAGGLARKLAPMKWASEEKRQMAIKAKGVQALYDIVEIDNKMRSFLEIAIRNVRWANSYFHTNIQLVIMTSFWTNEPIEEKLIEMKYYGLDERDVYLFLQQHCRRIVPSPEMLNYFLKSDLSESSYKKWHSACKKNQDKPLPNELGLGIFAPLGDLDALIVGMKSGIFLELWQKGIEYVFIRPINNPVATINDFVFNSMNQMQNEGTEALVVIVKQERRDRGFPILVEVNGDLLLLHPNAFPRDLDPKSFQYIATGSYLFKLGAIFKLFDITRSDIIRIQRVSKNERDKFFVQKSESCFKKFQSYPIFESTIPNNDRIHEIEYPNVHFEKLLCDFTHLKTLEIGLEGV